jgi:uncharacterized protein (DUF1501 family)
MMGAGAFAMSGMGRWNELSAAPSTTRTLVHILLEGGPDFRHLFVPPPNSNRQSYGYKYWNNRVSTTGRGSSSDNPARWQEIYNRFYEQVSRNGVTFGILKDANGRANANGWLINQFNAGNVAIINNVHHSTSRDHAHSLLVLQSGNYTTSAGTANAGGWGGRLITNTGANDKLVSFTRAIRPFCNTPNKGKILSFTNSRRFGLEQPGTNTNGALNQNDRGLRALQQYYHNAGTLTGPYAKFGGQRTKIQDLTTTIRSALPAPAQGQQFADVFSDRIKNLLTGNNRLNNQDFARQIANLRDAFTVRSTLGMVLASLNYGGWDSHKNQITDIEPQFDDLFGIDKGLDALIKDGVNYNDTTFLFTGEFGRQLKSNGDNGTDHGRANTVLVIGGSVSGGVYGEMFPAIEAAEAANGRAPYDNFNQDIEGRTAFNHVFNRLAGWLGGGTPLSAPNYTQIGLRNHDGGIERTGVTSGSAIDLNFI